MSGILPLQPQGPLILEALRLVEGTSTPGSTLAATPGAELKAVLMAISDQGLLLMLPDGRSLTAAGELPYPAGTELTFRIQPQSDGSTQLQPLRADPPPAPALLAPLVHGEAASLLQRLSAPDLPAALLPLKALLDRLPAPPAPSTTALPQPFAPLAEALGLPPEAPEFSSPSRPLPAEGGTAPTPPSVPSLETLTTFLVTRGLPPEPARAMALLLLGEPPSEAAPQAPATAAKPAPGQPPLPTEAAVAWAEGTAPAPAPPGTQAPPRLVAPALDPELLRAFGIPEPLIQERLKVAKDSGPPTPMASSASGAGAAADPDAQLRQLLDRLPAPLAQRVLALLTLLPPAGQGQTLPRQDPLAQLIRALLPQLQTPGEAPVLRTSSLARESPAAAPMLPSDPATWSRWLKEVTSTLARPEASPAEAPFHRLQAREGTALFEIPLPWAPESGTLELWAERDAPGPDRPEMQRVLLALNLGRTGELRVALQSGPAGVQAQVVATPEVAARLERLLREELGTPSPFPLQFRASSELPPRPRALAGTGLRALG